MKLLRGSRAFALVLVLITIVLTVTIAVFFLASAGRERRGISLYANSSEVRQLSATVVSRVIGQINAATKEGTATTPISWASQPGMVRTYNTTGALNSVYKLYSWESTPLIPGAGYDPTAASEVPPSDWATRRAEFIDLNQPINQNYPILDPNAETKVVGFTIDRSAPALSGSPNLAPMPVRWLYILKDGQLVAPSTQSGTSVNVTGATETNPIVGRVAYWTDDETSKVNLNTASEGSYWDWPKGATFDEMQFAGNPPVAGEFNRIPGHPAMTSLSPVFPELDPGDRWSGGFATKLATVLTMTPRVPTSTASSRGGTFPITSANYSYGPAAGVSLSVPTVPLALKPDRLLTSPDEFLFKPLLRALQPSLTPQMLSERAFFVTSTSRAPETTLFETPRISLWPITWAWNSVHASQSNRQKRAVSTPNPNTALLSTNTWMRAEERLLAFTSTLNKSRPDGGDKYFFQRQNPESPTHDYNLITRNQNLLTYLRRLTDQQIPGFSGSFATKYSGIARDSILANTFNTVRSMVNQYTVDTDGRMLYSFTPISFSRFLPPSGAIAVRNEVGAFNSMPIKVNLGSGEVTTLSEFPLLREVALSFFATARVEPIAPDISGVPAASQQAVLSNPFQWRNLINYQANGYVDGIGARTNRMRALMLLDFAPIGGSTRNNQPVFWVKISGATMTAGGTSLGFNGAVAKLDYQSAGSGKGVAPFLLPLYRKSATGTPNGVKTFTSGNVSDTNYGLISASINVNPAAVEFPFSGGQINVEIYGLKNGNPNIDPTGDSSLLVATYSVDFSSWNGQQPIPIAPRWNYYDINVATTGLQRFPNPNYKVFNPSGPETRWAAVEIAPGYRTASSAGDPALVPTGFTSTWNFNNNFGTNITNGSINVGTANRDKTVAYVFKSSGGAPLMTDIGRRLLFNNSVSGVGLAYSSEHTPSGIPLNQQSADGAFSAGFPVLTPYDTVLSVIANPTGPGSGDPRLARSFQFVRADTAVGGMLMRQVVPWNENPRLNRQYHTLGSANQRPAATGFITASEYSVLQKSIAPDGMAWEGQNVTNQGRIGYRGTAATWGDYDLVGVVSARPRATLTSASAGDWTSGPGFNADGGYVSRADQDFQSLTTPGSAGFAYQVPYFRTQNSLTDGFDSSATVGNFSVNRQIPSPISLMGSLPSSLTTGWQTLAFSPNPVAGPSHPGLRSPQDHLLLDLFWMPVAEPYPISEEFSTAGKVNLNYRIAPFNYIERKTAIYALMKSTWMTAFHNSLAKYYKAHDWVKGLPNSKTRYTINVEETLKAFDTKFNSGDIFRSASQLSEVSLVPTGSTAGGVTSFWSDKLLTSDTAREAPYDHMYSRVTTKSNTFTVHWRVQALRKPATNGNQGSWDEENDPQPQAELRGSTLIERFIDPNATNIPDYATDPSALSLANYYKWRTVSDTYFQP